MQILPDILLCCFSITREAPKSMSLQVKFLSIMIFSAFKSLWSSPLAWTYTIALSLGVTSWIRNDILRDVSCNLHQNPKVNKIEWIFKQVSKTAFCHLVVEALRMKITLAHEFHNNEMVWRFQTGTITFHDILYEVKILFSTFKPCFKMQAKATL